MAGECGGDKGAEMTANNGWPGKPGALNPDGEVPTDEMVRRLQHLGDWQAADQIEALQRRVAELEAQNEMLRHATNKLRAMLTELNARHEPLQRAFITAVELLNDAALEGWKDE